MKEKNRRSLAAILVLYLVASTSIPVYAAQTASRLDQFSIAINDALPAAEGKQFPGAPQAADSELTAETETEHTGIQHEARKERGGFFSAWSLPISGPMTLIRHKKQAQLQQSRELAGSISFEDPYESTSQHIEQLLECAWNRDPSAKNLDKSVEHFRKKTQVAIAEGKDAANYVIPFRGFGPSSEAGDIITGEKLKIKSKASAEYARQKHIDELHVKVVSNMMQIAMGLGMDDQERGQAVTTSGVTALKQLVGDEEADRTRAMLAQMASQIQTNDEIFSKPAWDVQERQKMHRQIMELSLDDDPVVHQIKKHIHKYNHRSKFAMVSSSVVQTMLGAASLTPTFVGPAAKTALVAFVMATGGPEQCKLLKELYLDKRLESRWKVLNEEAHMAVDNYQLAILTKNPVLLCYSESVVGQMVGGHHVNEVFGRSLFAKKVDTSNTM